MSAPPRELYLADDFDGSKLKVPQLRSILLEHGIRFPSTAKKADLVNLFTTEVQPRAARILAADAKVRPSGHGIIAVSDNGDEAPVEPSAGVKRPRGRPKKSTVEPEIDVDVEVVEAEPAPKKARSRRSTVEPEGLPAPKGLATPKKPRKSVVKKKLEDAAADMAPPVPPTPSRRKSRVPATPKPKLVPVAAPAPVPTPRAPSPSPKRERDLVPIVEIPSPVQRIPRTSFAIPSSDDDATPKRKPRVSVELDDGGFSDFNPFQAGSSQAAQAERRRRKSSLGFGEVKRRAPRPSEWTATSVPSDLPIPSILQNSAHVPPRTPSVLRRVGPSTDDLRSPPDEVRGQMRQEIHVADEQNIIVEQKIHKPKRKAIIRRRPQPAATTSTALSIGLSLMVFLLSSYYKTLASSNGFCDAGLATNDVILGREVPITNAQACFHRRADWLQDHDGEVAPFKCDAEALPLVPWFPRPTDCTPCPQHATCVNGEVTGCTPEYILTPHILDSLSPLVDGWPGLPTRAFPPYCRPDTSRMRQIGQLAHQIEAELARGRGDVVCNGDSGSASEAEKYGQLEDTLRESFAERRVAAITREKFDELFDAALQDLVEHGDVTEGIDLDGKAWYASRRAELTVSCRAKIQAQSLLERWKSQLSMTAGVLAAIFLFKNQIEKSQAEKSRAHDLARVVLKRLQDQEQLHYTDPVTTPQPYLPPAQLRDIVLPASESSASRSRLWARVETEIEKNSNIAVGEREVRGDMWKTWEWTGVGQRSVEYM